MPFAIPLLKSTSSLIAIMLGRLEMNVQECIDAYINLSEQVFVRKKSKMQYIPVAGNAWAKWSMKSGFDSSKLEEAIKAITQNYDKVHDSNAQLKTDIDPRCRV